MMIVCFHKSNYIWMKFDIGIKKCKIGWWVDEDAYCCRLWLLWMMNHNNDGVTMTQLQIDGLVQERCNSIANALELCLSCTNPSKLCRYMVIHIIFYSLQWALETYLLRQPNQVSILLQAPQYILITAGEVMFSVTGLHFAYSQVRGMAGIYHDRIVLVNKKGFLTHWPLGDVVLTFKM